MANPCLLYDNAIFAPSLTPNLYIEMAKKVQYKPLYMSFNKKRHIASLRHIGPWRGLLVNWHIKRFIMYLLTCNKLHYHTASTGMVSGEKSGGRNKHRDYQRRTEEAAELGKSIRPSNNSPLMASFPAIYAAFPAAR